MMDFFASFGLFSFPVFVFVLSIVVWSVGVLLMNMFIDDKDKG